jgi:hypothetical protein
MKILLIGTALIVQLSGCQTSPNAGRPGDDRYIDEGGDRAAKQSNERHTQSKLSNNLRSTLSN